MKNIDYIFVIVIALFLIVLLFQRKHKLRMYTGLLNGCSYNNDVRFDRYAYRFYTYCSLIAVKPFYIFTNRYFLFNGCLHYIYIHTHIRIHTYILTYATIHIHAYASTVYK